MTAGLFPDVEDLAIDLLDQFGTVGRITPPNLGDTLPYIRVGVIGGNDDGLTDKATLDVDVFADSIPASNLLAEQIRTFLLGTPVGMPHVVNGVVLDRITNVTRPRQFPYPTPDVFRNTATYRVGARRRTT